MPTLALRLCGDVALTASGIAVDPPPGAKALALLAFLAVEPGPHRREQVTALLWGDYPEENAKASLRQVLTHLRDTLGDALRVDRSTIELVGDLACDVSDFLRLAETDPSAAIAIDVPRFLSGLMVKGSVAFDDWADAKRAELLKMRSRLLANRVRESIAQRAWADARRMAEKWSALDPLADEPVAALVEAHFLAGDRDEALATYARHAARLTNETGRTPARSLVALASRVEQGGGNGAQPRRAAEPRTEPAPSFIASLLGRQGEWDMMARAWSEVVSDASRVVLIEGEPGVGKSRLTDDFLRWVAARGGVVLRGRGYDMRSSAPFGAVIDALHSALDAPGLAGVDPQWLAEVARVIPDLRKRFPGLPNAASANATADGWRLFEAIAQVLIAIAEENPVAVSIDDLQWCDAESCGLLQFLVRRLADARVFWCASFTLGETERDAPSARFARALRAAPASTSLTLGPLSESDVAQLLRELGRLDSAEAGATLAARVFEVTGGNPFYVVELLKTLFAQGLLAFDRQTETWNVPDGALDSAAWPVLAPTVNDAVADRIERLPDQLHAVLISIALAGRGCKPDLLSHLHGISRLHAAMLGDALVERHLVVEDGGVYRCAHPTIAHVVRARLSTSRAREVHRAHAIALELVLPAHGRVGADLAEIARHAEQAGETEMANRYALLASESGMIPYSLDRARLDERDDAGAPAPSTM